MATAAAAQYTTIGPYKSGVWLARPANGSPGIYFRPNLPPENGRNQYYWLGSNKTEAGSRLGDAINALNVDPLKVTDHTGWIGQISAIPGGTDPFPIPGIGPVGPIPDIFNSLTAGIGSTLDFLKLIAWLFHPRNILRAVEFLSGIVLVIFGLWAAVQARGEKLEGFTTGESPLTRSGLGRVARELGHAASGEQRSARRAARSSGESAPVRIRPRSAPHRQRRTALRVRYAREEKVARRGEEKRRGK